MGKQASTFVGSNLWEPLAERALTLDFSVTNSAPRHVQVRLDTPAPMQAKNLSGTFFFS